MKLFIVNFGLVLGLLFSVSGYGKDPAKGLEIAKSLDAMDTGFESQKSNMEMVLRDRHGRESSRNIRSSTLEVKGDGDKSLIIFDNPRTVKGTKFLSFTHKTESDDQWLFLPKLKRAKRIASDNKSGPFMGSEFAFEDISSQEVEKYTYAYLRDEKCDGGKDCHVVERYPTDKKSGYSRQLVWIVKGKGELRPVKIDFYDVKATHLKTLEFRGYQKYVDRFWRPGVMHMTNHVTGKQTELRFSGYEFKVGLNSKDFNQNALKRIR